MVSFYISKQVSYDDLYLEIAFCKYLLYSHGLNPTIDVGQLFENTPGLPLQHNEKTGRLFFSDCGFPDACFLSLFKSTGTIP